jgi:hypothetical protein
MLTWTTLIPCTLRRYHFIIVAITPKLPSGSFARADLLGTSANAPHPPDQTETPDAGTQSTQSASGLPAPPYQTKQVALPRHPATGNTILDSRELTETDTRVLLDHVLPVRVDEEHVGGQCAVGGLRCGRCRLVWERWLDGRDETKMGEMDGWERWVVRIDSGMRTVT